jgi:UDP:flavonoid glycosyltransferase YjiC (YdhE family)
MKAAAERIQARMASDDGPAMAASLVERAMERDLIRA